MKVDSAANNQSANRRLRRAQLFGALLLTFLALGTVSSSSAPATIIGLNEGGSWDQMTVGHSGASLFRVVLGWHQVAEQGDWHLPSSWEKSLDVKVEEAAKNGYSILGLFAEREQPGPKQVQYYLKSEEPEWIEFQRFAKMAVTRYGRGGFFWAQHPSLPYHPITVWEVWNEPNEATYAPNGTVNGKQYGEFLAATSGVIKNGVAERLKAGEPNDTVVLHAGLLPTLSPSASHMALEKFLIQATSASGYLTSFNGFGLHPYALNAPEKRLERFKEYVNEAQSALNTVGSSAPIWITELGWPAITEEGIEGSEAEQATLLTQSFNWAKTRPNIAEITWYNYQDRSLSLPGPKWAEVTGLRRIDGTFRPSWNAFRAQTGATGPFPGAPMAFQNNNSTLVTNFTLAGGEGTGQGMAAGTSPSIAKLPSGGYQSAFQANSGVLYTWGPAGNASTGQGMAAGTSPAITGLAFGGYEIAFQANTTALVRVGNGGNVNTGLGMAPGTSPSISGFNTGGYEIAFQANTNQLWITGLLGTTNTALGMAAGTSPSIVTLPSGGYEVAFQSNGGQLWLTGPSGNINTGLGMAPGTSPSITSLPGGGYEVAFQANGGLLWTYGAAGIQNWEQAMAPGTSPAIAGRSGGYQVAYQSSGGHLVTVGPGIGTDTGQGMAAGTSPAIAPE